MVPPKDPYIQVRVLDDIGEVLLSDQSSNLARHSMHFLKRTDAEQFISQVMSFQLEFMFFPLQFIILQFLLLFI